MTKTAVYLLLGVVALAGGCATGVYDSVLGGLDSIIQAYATPDKPARVYAGAWRNREPGSTYGHEATMQSVKMTPGTGTQMNAKPQSDYQGGRSRRETERGHSQYPPTFSPPYNAGSPGVARGDPIATHTADASSTPNVLDQLPAAAVPVQVNQAESLEREVWDRYRRFEFNEVFTVGNRLACLPEATSRQRATAFVLMGSVACIQGNVEQASAHFRQAVEAGPAYVPDPAVFPSKVCNLYREVASGCTENR